MPKRKLTSTSYSSNKRGKVKEEFEVPVYVVDLHDGAMIPFIDAIKSRDLPKHNVKMLHYDSHPDLGNIEKKSMHLIEAAKTGKFNKKGIDALTDIATWITPLVAAGYLNEVIWVCGHWCTQINEGTYELICGIDKKDGKLKTCDADGTNTSHAMENYWEGDEADGELENLLHKKQWTLHVIQYSKQGTLSEEQISLIRNVCNNEDWVLDIDEDFFSCNNPYKDSFAACFGLRTFNLMKKIYEIGSPGDVALKRILKKKLFLKSKAEFMKHPLVQSVVKVLNEEGFPGKKLMTDFYVVFNRYFTLPDDVKKQKIKVKDLVDFDVMHETGQLSTLPHHISQIDEIAAMGSTTYQLLKSMDRPVHVTIATSRTDRYLPDSQAKLIHGMLDDMMDDVYEDIEMIRRDKPKYSVCVYNSDEDSSYST